MDLRFIAVLFLLKYGRLTGWFFKTAGEGAARKFGHECWFEWSAGNEM